MCNLHAIRQYTIRRWAHFEFSPIFLRYIFSDAVDDYVTTHDMFRLVRLLFGNWTEQIKNVKTTHKRGTRCTSLQSTWAIYVIFTIARLHELHTRLNRNESFAHHHQLKGIPLFVVRAHNVNLPELRRATCNIDTHINTHTHTHIQSQHLQMKIVD